MMFRVEPSDGQRPVPTDGVAGAEIHRVLEQC